MRDKSDHLPPRMSRLPKSRSVSLPDEAKQTAEVNVGDEKAMQERNASTIITNDEEEQEKHRSKLSGIREASPRPTKCQRREDCERYHG